MGETQVWEPITPTGTALALLIVTCVFSVLIIIVLPLRFYIRLYTRCLGFEDWLMFAGFVDVIAQNGFIIYGSYTGIGSPDSKINTAQMVQCGLVVVFWQMTYVTSTALIKCSILWTLIRLTTQKNYHYPLYSLFVISAAVGTTSFFVALLRCKPINAAWTGKGKCLPQTVIIGFSYGISALNIVIDFSVAIIPMFLLRTVQMQRRLKVVTVFILSLGILASIATTIRMPYCNAYSLTTNQMWRMGDLLWTNFECGLGIIAGSLPMLRKLFKSLASSESKSSDNPTPRIDLITIGGGGGGVKRRWNLNKHPYEAGITVLTTASGDEEEGWEEWGRDKRKRGPGDDESTRKMIRNESIRKMIRDESGNDRVMVTGRVERTVSMRDGSDVKDVAKYHGF
ncbi:hypothetical protein E6O75_ATG08558 [Venturia nashicola]|uniref:Rhodopsin domain-containing protein n=1 Tax=Venturia nashicola TaxID=86259 RepID=A0A4Z1NQP4_9PEZI|nr:hypothetical protein E6O75_ATG08558 [Venturia nashicola]